MPLIVLAPIRNWEPSRRPRLRGGGAAEAQPPAGAPGSSGMGAVAKGVPAGAPAAIDDHRGGRIEPKLVRKATGAKMATIIKISRDGSTRSCRVDGPRQADPARMSHFASQLSSTTGVGCFFQADRMWSLKCEQQVMNAKPQPLRWKQAGGGNRTRIISLEG